MTFQDPIKDPPEKKEITSLASIPTVSFLMWMFLLAIGVICLLIGIWAFFGHIPVTIQGKGIIISPAGLASIQAKIEGTVENLQVKPEQEIRKGTFLLKIFDPQLELKFLAADARVKTTQKELEQLKKEIESEKEADQAALQSKLDATQFNISQLGDEIDFLTRELEAHKILLDKGLIPATTIHGEEQTLIQRKIDLEVKISTLNEIISEIKKEYRPQELQNKEHQLREELAQKDLFQVSIDQSRVISPYDGKVLEVMVNAGDRVQPGSQLVWLEKKSSEKDNPSPLIYAYFPIETGERITLKTPIEMTVPQINHNEYGSLYGKVINISKYAVSKDNIINRIQNQSIANSLMGSSSAAVEVTIKPEMDPNHPKEFMWTSGKQPDLKITTGTIGEAEATVEKVRPIYYLLPLKIFKIEQ